MKSTLIVVTALMACACTPLSQQQLEAREYRNFDWESRYADYAYRCRLAGGRVLVQASSGTSRSGVPARSDYYQCTRSMRAATRG